MSRAWAMPSAETFSIPPIAQLVKWWLRDCKVIIDPFARNSHLGTITNDLNPETEAQHHLDAIEFLRMLINRNTIADAVIFDPPYSVRQVNELYQVQGIDKMVWSNWTGMRELKQTLTQLTRSDGIAICCGWTSNGLGMENGWEMEEVLLVPHGGGHNDTIVTVERKRLSQQVFNFGGNNGTALKP
jgi:hypothetical protein